MEISLSAESCLPLLTLNPIDEIQRRYSGSLLNILVQEYSQLTKENVLEMTWMNVNLS